MHHFIIKRNLIDAKSSIQINLLYSLEFLSRNKKKMGALADCLINLLRPQLHDTGFASERHHILLLRGEFGI